MLVISTIEALGLKFDVQGNKELEIEILKQNLRSNNIIFMIQASSPMMSPDFLAKNNQKSSLIVHMDSLDQKARSE